MGLGERQKRNLQALQEIATSTHGFRIGGGSKDAQDMDHTVAIGTNAPLGLDGTYEYSLTHSHITGDSAAQTMVGSLGEPGQSPSRFLGTAQQPQLFPKTNQPLTPESLQEHNTLSQLIEEEGVVLDEKTKVHILEKKITLQSILKAGLKALSHETSADRLPFLLWEWRGKRQQQYCTPDRQNLAIAERQHSAGPIPARYPQKQLPDQANPIRRSMCGEWSCSRNHSWAHRLRRR